MDVRFCQGRNHRREARVRAAGSARVRRARSCVARLRRISFSLTKTYMEVGKQEAIHKRMWGRLWGLLEADFRSVGPSVPQLQVSPVLIGIPNLDYFASNNRDIANISRATDTQANQSPRTR